MGQRLFLAILVFFMNTRCLAMAEDHKKVGIYWGAFDPMTEAHREIIKMAVLELSLDEIVIVVNNHNYKQYMLSLDDRKSVVQTALLDLGIEHAQVLAQDDTNPLGFEELRKFLTGKLFAIAGYDSYKAWCFYAQSNERTLFDTIVIVPRGDDVPILIDENARLLTINSRFKYTSSTEVKKKIQSDNLNHQ